MTRSAAFRSLGLVALLGCGDRLVEHPGFEALSPQQRPSKSRVEWQGRTLESSSPAGVAHDTRFADRYFFGVVGGDTETAWRFHMRLTAADLRAGTVRGELAALLDVEDQLDTGRSRVGYAAVASTTAGEELVAEASVGTFEATLSAHRISGSVHAQPGHGLDVSATFDAELEAVCMVEDVRPPDPRGGSSDAEGKLPPRRQDRTLDSPGCEALRAFAAGL